jgi:hypothetical protein
MASGIPVISSACGGPRNWLNTSDGVGLYKRVRR